MPPCGINFIAIQFCMGSGIKYIFFVVFLWQTTVAAGQQLTIKGQRDLSVKQNGSITLSLDDITVEADRKLNYPSGFYLETDEGNNYSVSGNEIIPVTGFAGELKVQIRVTNGDNKTNKFNLKIRVEPAGGAGNSIANSNDDGDNKDKDRGKDKGKDKDKDKDKDGDKEKDKDKDKGGSGDDDDNEGNDNDDDEDNEGNDNGNDDDNDNDNEGNGNDDGNEGNGNGNGDGAGESNQKPTIVNQVGVEINQNQSFKIELSHLVVSDPDNNYPNDFILKIEAGSNYTVSGTTITPSLNFTGNLAVKVIVSDGQIDSEAFNFVVVVEEVAPSNVKPEITAQSSLSTFKNEALTIRLVDLSVTDPDDSYPGGFTLIISEGSNYTVSGNTIAPSNGFLGTLTVKIKVNDGSDDSDVFDLKINVVERDKLQVIGQSPIIIPEDSSYIFTLNDLRVNDPSATYPAGFAITILNGDHYTIDGLTVHPAKDYHGNLLVPLKIEKAGASSNIYEALIVVQPINDPPTFLTFDETPIASQTDAIETEIAREVKTGDIDNDKLAYAEVQLDSIDYNTTLSYTNTESIRGIFDQPSGILVFLGEASLAEYDQALQSITVSSSDSSRRIREVYFRLNDGTSYSAIYTKTITREGTDLDLIIPTAFTPNNDNANDTWEISLLQRTENTRLELRIYNNKGLLLFESDSFDKAWDGRYNGEILPADSYFYTLTLIDSRKQERRHGVVTILR
jgi:gliding motility-associated-like protein